MKRDDDNLAGDGLEPMLRAHFSRRLDAQRGRSLAAFEREPALRDHRPHPLRLVPLVIGSAIAATLLIAWAMLQIDQEDGRLREVAHPIDDSDRSIVAPAANDLEPGDLERLITWQAIDEGSRIIDSSPLRRVRVEAMEEIRWADPDLNATFRLAVPQNQVILVRQQTF